MKMVNGKTNSGPSLMELVGFSHFAKFGAETVEDYEGKLRAMNLSDLQAHALRLSVMPKTDRARLTNTLVKEFKKALAKRDAARLPNNGGRSAEREEAIQKNYRKLF